MSALSTTAPRKAPATGARTRRRPHLRVVGPPRHDTRYVVAILVLSAVGVFGIVSLSALAAEAAFHARALERDIGALTLRYEELTAEVATLESPERVRAVAVDQLGMVPAEQAAYLVVDEPLDGLPVGPPPADVEPDGGYLLADPLKPALGGGG